MTTHKPPTLNKLTAAGKLKGRPRRGLDQDREMKMPSLKRDTRPGPTTVELIKRIVAKSAAEAVAGSMSGANRGYGKAFEIAQRLFSETPSISEVEAVDRWLRDPLRRRVPGDRPFPSRGSDDAFLARRDEVRATISEEEIRRYCAGRSDEWALTLQLLSQDKSLKSDG